MHALLRIITFTLACLMFAPVVAADFDGSKPLICATIEARDCVLSSECYTGEAQDVGAPPFFRIDFDKKLVYGTENISPIVSMEKGSHAILLQGSEIGYGWSIGISLKSGEFSASLTNFEGTFLLFGSCTPI